MNTPVRLICAIVLVCFVAGSAPLVFADDGAASIAAGGIVVMGHEPRITMAKEVLKISESKIAVDYDFRNDTGEDVTTEVAFPIPPYEPSLAEISPADQGFDDFHLWVNGAPAKFRTQSRAVVKGKDLTSLLEEMHVDVASFGHANLESGSAEILKLSASDRKRLEQAGLIDADGWPNWEVHRKYYWRQTFPAHSTTRIRHEYVPVTGSFVSIKDGLGFDPSFPMQKPSDYCIDPKLEAALRKTVMSTDAPYSWVDFILTSANTWKTPIEDFTLIVERPKPEDKDFLPSYVSFCWDGPVEKPDADHFVAKARNLVPKRELKIGFFTRRR